MPARRSRSARSASRARASGESWGVLLLPVLPLFVVIVLVVVVVVLVAVVVFVLVGVVFLVLVVVIVVLVRRLELEGGEAVDHEARAALRTVDDIAFFHVELVDFQIVRVARRAGRHFSRSSQWSFASPPP